VRMGGGQFCQELTNIWYKPPELSMSLKMETRSGPEISDSPLSGFSRANVA